MRLLLLRLYCLFAVFFFAGISAHAQNASRIYVEPTGWSLGTYIGMTDLFGDVGTASVLEHYRNSKYLDKVAFNGGMYGRYTIHPALSLKFGLGFGSFYASDEWNFDLAKKAKTQGEDAYQRYARAIKSKAYIFESMLLFEFSPFRYNPESRKAHRRGQPYIGAGVGYFHFEPYSNVAMSNTFVKTFPLKIEGNGFGDSFPKSYSLWQPSIPFVVGYRWDIGEHLNLGIEYCYRKTFTDYLDGVSGKYIDPAEYSKHLSANEAANARDVQDKAIYSIYTQPHTPGQMRGNPADKDAYGSFNITFYYKVFTRTKEWWHIF